MEITESTIYWITRLDSIKAVMQLGLLFASILPVFVAMLSAMLDEENKMTRRLKTILPISCVLFLIAASSVFVPTTKEMCAIKAIPIIVNDKSVKNIPANVAELANDWIKELSPKQGD